jgi:hypothetical protein
MKTRITIPAVLLIFNNTFSQQKSENKAPLILQTQTNFNGFKMKAKSLLVQSAYKSEKDCQYVGDTPKGLGLFQKQNKYYYPNIYESPYQFYNEDTYGAKNEYGYIGTTNLDSFFIQRMNTLHIPGLAACIIKDTSIIWTGSYGYANIKENRKVSDSTVFMLASISKTFVAVALMQLYREGLFNLDDNINNYLPWSVNHPKYPDSTITFKMLLTHTSAINDNSSKMPYYPGDSPNGIGESPAIPYWPYRQTLWPINTIILLI